MARILNVIAVMSPKGGVGKTVTTVNLAAALALKFNKKILAIDTNVSTASLGLHLDVFYPKITLHDILNKGFSAEKAIYRYHENLHIIPASIKIKRKDKNLYDVRKNIQRIIFGYDKLLKELSKKYDLILLDCAPGFDLESMASMNVAGGLLFVTNPDYPSLVTTVKAVEYAKLSGVPVGGIVLNKVMNKKYELKKDEIEKVLKVKIIETIPFDKKIPKSIAKRIPIVLSNPYSKSAKAYKRLAARLAGMKNKKKSFSIKKLFKK